MEQFLEIVGRSILPMFRMSIPLTLVALGGVFSSRVGIVAMGLEGIMLGGAFGAAYGAYITGSAYLGLLSGMLSGMILSLVYAILCIRYKIDQVIGGVGLNLFSQGLTTLLLQVVWGNRGKSVLLPSVSAITLPFIGEISPLFIITIVFVVLSSILIYKTQYGLQLRMIGEHPKAALSVGINVNKIRYSAMIISGLLAGLGGAYLSIDHLNMFARNMTAGRGFIALAIDILGRYNPFGVFFGSLLFGFFDSIQVNLQSDKMPGQLIQTIPYVVTLLVIIFAVKYVRTPAALGDYIDD